jgi:cardiolipin synthase
MEHVHWITTAVLLGDLLIRVGLSLRVIKRRLPVGVSLAWLAVILILPYAGALLYLLFGEYRLGRRRTRRAAEVGRVIRERFPRLHADAPAEVSGLGTGGTALARVAESALECPPLPGNALRLLENAAAAFPALIEDIDRAERTCDLEFYIWSVGGVADEVAAALLRAAGRGVACRVLVDAVGSAAFLRSGLAADLRRGKVQVRAALPAGLLRAFMVRPDLRLHRKIAVIDGVTAYTGSLNLADPRLFKQNAGVGRWVDALARVQGPAVQALALTFLEDWAVETCQDIDWKREADVTRTPAAAGPATVQVLPTGPDARVEAIEQVLLTAVYAAARELVLTTPYFVPDESLLFALKSAASRGVQVTLIVPAKVDSHMVKYASRAHQADLLEAGVRIAQFEGGLLHTKSITVDDQFSLFGSLNLDPRSLRLDFEITLAVYDADFTRALRRLQQTYLDRSHTLDLAACRARSAVERFAEDTARLVGPLL